MSKLIDLTGQKFYALTVVKRTSDYISPTGHRFTMWLCKCDCGNEVVVQGQNLRNGHTKSCGCYRRAFRKEFTKLNQYDLSGKWGIGYTSNTNEQFFFDLEDYEKIKDYTWFVGKNGYLYSKKDEKFYLFHRMILNIENRDVLVDHINHNKLDNRKNELRIINKQNNARNRQITSSNASGFIGTRIRCDKKKYEAYINLDGVKVHLGSFDSFTEAVKIRIEAEIEHFDEFMYLPHLKVLDYINNGGKLEYGNRKQIESIINN